MAWPHMEEGGLQSPGIHSNLNFSYDPDTQGVQSAQATGMTGGRVWKSRHTLIECNKSSHAKLLMHAIQHSTATSISLKYANSIYLYPMTHAIILDVLATAVQVTKV